MFVFTEAKLKEIEDEKVRTILKSCIKYEASGKITSEQLHVMVENEIGYSVQYSDIERELLKEFDRLTAGYR